MRAPREFCGLEFYNTWTNEKIVPINRLMCILRFTDKDGNPTDPVMQGLSEEIPKAIRHEVNIQELVKDVSEVTVIECGWAVSTIIEMSMMGLEQRHGNVTVLSTKYLWANSE